MAVAASCKSGTSRWERFINAISPNRRQTLLPTGRRRETRFTEKITSLFTAISLMTRSAWTPLNCQNYRSVKNPGGMLGMSVHAYTQRFFQQKKRDHYRASTGSKKESGSSMQAEKPPRHTALQVGAGGVEPQNTPPWTT